MEKITNQKFEEDSKHKKSEESMKKFNEWYGEAVRVYQPDYTVRYDARTEQTRWTDYQDYVVSQGYTL